MQFLQGDWNMYSVVSYFILSLGCSSIRGTSCGMSLFIIDFSTLEDMIANFAWSLESILEITWHILSHWFCCLRLQFTEIHRYLIHSCIFYKIKMCQDIFKIDSRASLTMQRVASYHKLKSKGPILLVTSSETRSVCVKQALNTRRWLVNALVNVTSFL